MDNLREVLCSVMYIKGWSQRELSIQCDLSHREIQYILGGKPKDIRLSTILRISDGLEIPINKLLGDSLIEEEDMDFLNRLHTEIGAKIRDMSKSKRGRLTTK